MIDHLIAYVKDELDCSTNRATEIAYFIMDDVDLMIHSMEDKDDEDN